MGAAVFRHVCYAEKIKFIAVLFLNFNKTTEYPFSGDKREGWKERGKHIQELVSPARQEK